MASSEKRCHYEILGLPRDCSPDEIRSAYKKLALQRHPDKLIKTGIPEEQATAMFQELVSAYELLSDPRERAWYDSHRSQILFSDSKSSKSAGSVPDLFSFFSTSVYSGFSDKGKGFYKVYGDIFDKIYTQEVTFVRKLGLGEDSVRVSPLMGNLDSPFTQVTAFYNYWLGFVTVMDFCWVDEYDVMAGPDRKSRRKMEQENEKLRKKARREYNDTVRGLAEFVKKRDKRIIDMQAKRVVEQEKKKEEEKARKKEAERVKLERAKMYEEPDWAKIDEEEAENVLYEEEVESKTKHANELFCVVCSKKFKSDKQWKNHEQSKKHREKVVELRDTYGSEEEEEGEELDGDADFGASASAHDDVDELREKFENDIGFQEEKSGHTNSSVDEEGNEVLNSDNESHKTAPGRKNKKKSTKHPKSYPTSSEFHASAESEDMDLMGNNSRRNARKNRAAKREGPPKSKVEKVKNEIGEETKETISTSNGDADGDADDSSNAHDTSSQVSEEVDLENTERPLPEKHRKRAIQRTKKKVSGKGDTIPESDNIGNGDAETRVWIPSRGRKQKGGSKKSGLLCETCGEDFESKNKLHKHLGDTGHAAIKSK
ncbi:hypothetical protein ACHQM5_006607 [Ranunculus cassubicifolius]